MSDRSSARATATRHFLSPKQKLLRRFYEPLILLAVLGKTRGEQQPAAWPKLCAVQDWPMKYVRRLLLKELAYVSDYDTGGDSVTAIGLESGSEGRTIWIAANTSPEQRIVPFITHLLDRLRTAPVHRSEPFVDSLAVDCIMFSRRRVKAYRDFMRKAVEKVEPVLVQKISQNEDYSPLVPWLRHFCDEERAHSYVCRAAYTAFDCSEMKLLERLCLEPSFRPDRNAPHQQFRVIRHYIGRLGHHHKAAKALVICASRMPSLFDGLSIRALETPSRAAPPLIPHDHDLGSIIKRMCAAGSAEADRYQERVLQMDALFSIKLGFQQICGDPNFRPRVHAEIQILQHFYQNNLLYEDLDAYVACSKPACYCCYLYFKHHPSGPVLPATHQRIHRNWSPPDIDGRTPNLQRDVLNLMIQDIRRDVFVDLDGRHPRVAWHPDSTTGISAGLPLLIEDDRLWPDTAEAFVEAQDSVQHAVQASPDAVEPSDVDTVDKSRLSAQSYGLADMVPLVNPDSDPSSSDESDGGVPLPPDDM